MVFSVSCDVLGFSRMQAITLMLLSCVLCGSSS